LTFELDLDNVNVINRAQHLP